MFVGILIFIPFVMKGIKLKFMVKRRLVNDMMHFSFGNYCAGIVGGLPGMLFPLMIVNMFRPEYTAYFYVAWVIAGVVFMIPGAVASSLLAEGSNEPRKLAHNLKRALKFSFLFVILAIAAIFIFDEKLLLLFGHEYSESCAELLRILAISSILMVTNVIYIAKVNVEKRIDMLLLLTIIGSGTTLTASYILLTKMGLIGIGYGWMVGQGAILTIVTFDWLRQKRGDRGCQNIL